MNTKQENEDRLTLGLLEAVAKDNDISQRKLAGKLGVALGLTNSYLKRCVKKGLVKVKEAPANRYLYFLTPKGFAEKSRLTSEYLSVSLNFYRRASISCDQVLRDCEKQGAEGVYLYGASDLAEIVILRSAMHEVPIERVVDPQARTRKFLNYPLTKRMPEKLGPGERVVLTNLNAPLQCFDWLVQHVGRERVLAPDILGLQLQHDFTPEMNDHRASNR